MGRQLFNEMLLTIKFCLIYIAQLKGKVFDEWWCLWTIKFIVLALNYFPTRQMANKWHVGILMLRIVSFIVKFIKSHSLPFSISLQLYWPLSFTFTYTESHTRHMVHTRPSANKMKLDTYRLGDLHAKLSNGCGWSRPFSVPSF